MKNNTEQKGILFTPLEKCKYGNKHKLDNFENIEELVKIYNEKLYKSEKQQARRLIIKNDYIFIEGYKNDTVSIIETIKNLTKKGIENYSNTVKHWIENKDYSDVSDEKKNALINMFEKSKVCLIYGAAGTGKTTLISYISTFFKEYSRLYLAHTNPAVSNLKSRVMASSKCDFMTIAKFNNKYAKDIKRDYDILIIDECSTVSNRNMRELLELASFKLLILVGDTYQIEAIEFGNWFDAVRNFLPRTSVYELTIPYRSESRKLLELWDNVRKMEDDVLDRLHE